MAKPPNEVKSLSEAIERLEAIGRSAGSDLKERLGTDYKQVLDTLETLKPHLEELKKSATEKAGEKKSELEHHIKQNPWMILGVIGLVALVIGWFLGHSRSQSPSDDDRNT